VYDDATLGLFRNNMDNTQSLMAIVHTYGCSGDPTTTGDTSIDHGQIDNSQYSYFLRWDTEYEIVLFGVVIEYLISEVH
jgi:hypothetical protein